MGIVLEVVENDDGPVLELTEQNIALDIVSPTPEATVVEVVNPDPAVEIVVATGVRGAPGPGVPVGGADGQVLAKASASDFDTEWVTPEAAGSAVSSVNGQTGAVVLDADDIADGTTNHAFTAADDTKLAGIATGATANDTNANLRDRSTHTGTQAISTVTGLQTALDGKAANSHTHTASQVTDFTTAVDSRIQNVIGTAPANLDTLGELADALADDANFAATVTTNLAGKQPIDSDLTAIANLTPTDNDVLQRKSGSWINRTIAQLKADLGLTKTDVGLGNVDNTSDANKPVSTATQSALDAKAPINVVPDGGLVDEALVKVNSSNRNTTWKRMLKWFGDIVTLPDSATQFLRVNIPSDGTDTSTWPDRMAFYFNGTRTGYFNEYGEARARAASPSTVALRTQGHVSNTTTDVFQATSSDNATIYLGAGPNGLKGPGTIRHIGPTQPSTTGWVANEFWYDTSTEV